jgi:hypothetical protein
LRPTDRDSEDGPQKSYIFHVLLLQRSIIVSPFEPGNLFLIKDAAT